MKRFVPIVCLVLIAANLAAFVWWYQHVPGAPEPAPLTFFRWVVTVSVVTLLALRIHDPRDGRQHFWGDRRDPKG